MEKSWKGRNNLSSNMRLMASSLYYLYDISNNDSNDCAIINANWENYFLSNPIPIGRGHFSKVYKVKCSLSGSTLAIKVIRRKRIGTDKIEEIMQEIEIMNITKKSLNSGFIKLLKVYICPKEVALLMEFATGGALYSVTQDSEEGLPEIYVRIVLTKILSALSFLHQQNIVHLDIKADNILLRHPYPSTDVALADFGISKKLTTSKVYREMIGTPDYIAPEVINYDEITVKSDMWSVGVLTYFLLTNVSPFIGDSKENTLYRVTKTEFSFVGKLSETHMVSARTFINSLLVKVPQNRLSADECISHDFLCNIPVLECASERKTFTDVIVQDVIDGAIDNRENSFHCSRVLAMSQNDLNCAHKLLESCDVETFEEGRKLSCNEMTEERKGSVYSIDQGHEDIVCVEVTQEGKGTDLNEETEMQSTDVFLENKEVTERSEIEDDDNKSFCDSDSEFSDTSTETSDYSDKYNSVPMKQGCGKENYRPEMNEEEEDDDCFDWHSNTVACRSITRVTKSSLINGSFRSSREYIICDTIDPSPLDDSSSCLSNYRGDLTETMISVCDGYKRRSLLKSLKKNCDKPQLLLSDKWSRRSMILSSGNHFDDDVDGDDLVDYEFISASNPALATPDKGRLKKNYTVRIADLFKSKNRVKESKKKEKVMCVVS